MLVEGPSKSAQKRASTAESGGFDIVQLVGRSVRDHIVVFDGPRTLIGQILPVRIEKVDAFTLFGRVEVQAADSRELELLGRLR